MKPSPWADFRQKAARRSQRILLAEGEDPRVIQAAIILQKEKIAQPFLVGSRTKIETLLKQAGGKLADIACLDPEQLTSDEKKVWAEAWLSISKNKQFSLETP